MDAVLGIDVGTGSVRAALLTAAGETLVFVAEEHEQIVPHYGWSEQRPADVATELVTMSGQSRLFQ